jgi:hypothetical protein
MTQEQVEASEDFTQKTTEKEIEAQMDEKKEAGEGKEIEETKEIKEVKIVDNEELNRTIKTLTDAGLTVGMDMDNPEAGLIVTGDRIDGGIPLGAIGDAEDVKSFAADYKASEGSPFTFSVQEPAAGGKPEIMVSGGNLPEGGVALSSIGDMATVVVRDRAATQMAQGLGDGTQVTFIPGQDGQPGDFSVSVSGVPGTESVKVSDVLGNTGNRDTRGQETKVNKFLQNVQNARDITAGINGATATYDPAKNDFKVNTGVPGQGDIYTADVTGGKTGENRTNKINTFVDRTNIA